MPRFFRKLVFFIEALAKTINLGILTHYVIENESQPAVCQEPYVQKIFDLWFLLLSDQGFSLAFRGSIRCLSFRKITISEKPCP